MTAALPFLVVLGGVVLAAGVALFVATLVAVRRGTRSANLEHGYVLGMMVAAGLGLLDWGVGWPGWPVPAYLLVGFGLAALFAIVIAVMGRR